MNLPNSPSWQVKEKPDALVGLDGRLIRYYVITSKANQKGVNISHNPGVYPSKPASLDEQFWNTCYFHTEIFFQFFT